MWRKNILHRILGRSITFIWTSSLLPTVTMKLKKRRRREGKGREKGKGALNKTCWKKCPLLQCCTEEKTSGVAGYQMTSWYMNLCCLCSGLTLHNLKFVLSSRKINGPALSKLDTFVSVDLFRQNRWIPQTSLTTHRFSWVWLCLNRLAGL